MTMLKPQKWGVAFTFTLPFIKRGVVDLAVSADYTAATGDCKWYEEISGSVANTTNPPAIVGGTGAASWRLTLTASEMQSTQGIGVQFIDSATKAVEDQWVVIPIDYGIRSNTAQAGAASAITLDASASAVDDFYRGMIIEIIGGTGVGQMRRVASYVGSTKVATVNRSWATNPDNASIFRLGNTAFGETDVTHIGGTAQTGRDLGASVLLSSGTGTGQLDFTSGVVKSNLWQIMDSALTGTAAQISAAFSTFFNVVTPSGTVNSIPDVLNVQGFSNDAITAASLDVSAVTEIQSGLATSSALATLAGYVDTEVAAIKAKTDNLPSDPADASDIATAFSGVNAKLDTIDDFLDTEVAAIKAKTDLIPADPADASDIAASFTTVNGKLDTIDDYIDTEIAALATAVGDLPTNSELATALAGLSIPTADQNATAVWTLANGTETSITPQQALRLILAASVGELSGAEGTTITIRDANDTKVRITATVTADGNRTQVVTDAT